MSSRQVADCCRSPGIFSRWLPSTEIFRADRANARTACPALRAAFMVSSPIPLLSPTIRTVAMASILSNGPPAHHYIVSAERGLWLASCWVCWHLGWGRLEDGPALSHARLRIASTQLASFSPGIRRANFLPCVFGFTPPASLRIRILALMEKAGPAADGDVQVDFWFHLELPSKRGPRRSPEPSCR
jgi:hypothetical protein